MKAFFIDAKKCVFLQARHDGICQKRRELYSQCFDEVLQKSYLDSPTNGQASVGKMRCGDFQFCYVPSSARLLKKIQYLLLKVIRQLTLGCMERGLMLLRV